MPAIGTVYGAPVGAARALRAASTGWFLLNAFELLAIGQLERALRERVFDMHEIARGDAACGLDLLHAGEVGRHGRITRAVVDRLRRVRAQRPRQRERVAAESGRDDPLGSDALFNPLDQGAH